MNDRALTLILLRHAKSSWSDAALSDHDRPLNARGRRAAPAVAAYLAQHGHTPALILCSTARRTRETLGLAIGFFRDTAAIQFDRAIYHAGDAEALLSRIQAVESARSPLMLIGHNPVIQELAQRLCGKDEAQARQRLSAKYPTAAAAILKFDEPRWRDIDFKKGVLIDFVLPRDLEIEAQTAAS